MEDLGVKFGRDRSFTFDHFYIDEIVFDDTDDITLYCRVLYYGDLCTATFGLTFDQLNTILRSIKNVGELLATALADRLKTAESLEVPISIRLQDVMSIPLEVTSCILYTTLYELDPEDDDEEPLTDEEMDEIRRFNDALRDFLNEHADQVSDIEFFMKSEPPSTSSQLNQGNPEEKGNTAPDSDDSEDEDDDDDDDDDYDGDDDLFMATEYAFVVDDIDILPPTS